MNIYFACSITGGREFERVYQDLAAALLMDGQEVPTAHLAESSVMALEAAVAPREIYERDVVWICAGRVPWLRKSACRRMALDMKSALH